MLLQSWSHLSSPFAGVYSVGAMKVNLDNTNVMEQLTFQKDSVFGLGTSPCSKLCEIDVQICSLSIPHQAVRENQSVWGFVWVPLGRSTHHHSLRIDFLMNRKGKSSTDGFHAGHLYRYAVDS